MKMVYIAFSLFSSLLYKHPLFNDRKTIIKPPSLRTPSSINSKRVLLYIVVVVVVFQKISTHFELFDRFASYKKDILV